MRISKEKIKSLKDLDKIIARLKKAGKSIAFTNGCFDILHFGHVSYLESAKSLAGILVVAVNSDASVKRIKDKKRPYISLKYRLGVIAGLESVDFVTSFEQNTPYKVIKLLKPDILIKGGDWDLDKIIGKDIVESYGGRVITLPFKKGLSSSEIINKIGKAI